MPLVEDEKKAPPPVYNAVQPAELPPGWEEMKDPRSGRTFYVNHITKSTTWDRPAVEPPKPAAPPSYNMAAAAPQPAPVARPAPISAYGAQARPAPRFMARIVVGQKVRIKKGYQQVNAKEIGTVVSANPDGSVEIIFGRKKIGFQESEIEEWLEPWAGKPVNVAQPYEAPVSKMQAPVAMPAAPVGPQIQTIRFTDARMGLEFQLENGYFVISKVHMGFEAARKRVGIGMRMISITDANGDQVKGSTAPQLAGHMGQAPRPVTIQFATGYGAVRQSVYDRNAYYVPRRPAVAASPAVYVPPAQPVAYVPQAAAYNNRAPVAYQAQPVAYQAQPVAYQAQPVAYQAPLNNQYRGQRDRGGPSSAMAAGAVGLGAGVLGAAVIGSMMADDCHHHSSPSNSFSFSF